MQAGKWLLTQRWPLNVRELSQALEVAAALAEEQIIDRAHLVERKLGAGAPSEEKVFADPEELRGRIVSLMEKHKGNVSYVARDMSTSRSQVHRWMQRFAIDADAYRA